MVWPGAIALARYLAPDMTPKTRIFELGCGTGFLGLALRAAGAGHVTLSDEFVELACANASLTEDGCDAPIIVRRVRWGHPDDAEDDPPPAKEYMWDPDVRKGILPHEPTATAKNLKELPQEGRLARVYCGGGADADGRRTCVIGEGDQRRLEHAVSRGLEATAFIAMAAQESEKCATSSFLNLAKKDLKIVHIKKDVPNVKEGEIDGRIVASRTAGILFGSLNWVCLDARDGVVRGCVCKFLSWFSPKPRERDRTSVL